LQDISKSSDVYRASTVFADVANELTIESLHGSEDASRNHAALDLGKPEKGAAESLADFTVRPTS
jgi:hypothetical protein